MDAPLTGMVAVVAGATRGAGRGIARALGEAGATVYCTGRSVHDRPSPYNRPETIEETAEKITAAGGAAFAVRVDHTVEAEVEALFARVKREQGRLDVLVNSIAGEDPLMAEWASLWNANLSNGEMIFRQSLLSHIITAQRAARLMIEKWRGLIVEVTEGDTLIAGGNILAQIVKVSQKALAVLWATDLRKHGVAAVAITPGLLRSERMLENFGVTEDTWRDAGKKDRNFLSSESPLFIGRAIAALAQDPAILEQSGQLLSSWEVGRKYDLRDADGSRPDWGAANMDYSQVPPPLIEALLDAAQIQTEWLRILLKRTEHFRNSLQPVSRATPQS